MGYVLGERLRIAREWRRLTQAGLGAKLNLSHSTINRYESGLRSPPSETLKRLADTLGVSTDYLLGRTGEPETNTTQGDEVAFVLRATGELTDVQRAKLVEFIDFLRFQQDGRAERAHERTSPRHGRAPRDEDL